MESKNQPRQPQADTKIPPAAKYSDADGVSPVQVPDELRELIVTELHDVARKAQVDYVAVNHPNGIRSGETPELLAEFLKVNCERLERAIASHTAKAVAEARIDELKHIREFWGQSYDVTLGGKFNFVALGTIDQRINHLKEQQGG